MILDGKKIAQEIADDLAQKDGTWREKIFAAFLVGKNEESESFLKQKKTFAEKLGVDFRIFHIAENKSKAEIRKEIGRIVRGSRFGGGIVQLPLPEEVNEQPILNAIPKEKDVDCLGERALGGFYTNRWIVGPPSVMALERILSKTDIDLKKSNVVVVGRGRLIGKPIALWLMDKVRDLHVLYLDDEADVGVLQNADIVISGIGRPHLIAEDYIKEGAIVVDYGYARKDGVLMGDVNVETCKKKASLITPTPGGTGPVVVAELFYNFYLLNAE